MNSRRLQSLSIQGSVIFALVIGILTTVAKPANAQTIYVPGDYATIQQAIDASNPGDSIIVSPGTYARIVIGAEGVQIIGTDPMTTEIDGGGVLWTPVVMFNDDGGTPSRLEGFKITHGHGTGAGIKINAGASPNIVNCIIDGNLGDPMGSSGVGVYIAGGASPLLDGCSISNNTQANAGGGVYAAPDSSAIIQNCQIFGNTAFGNMGGGGGIYSAGNTLIENCQIWDNEVNHWGGGINIDTLGADQTTIKDCQIFNNNVIYTDGGGIMVSSPAMPTIINSVIRDNTAARYGGGLYLATSNLPSITNCVIIGNSALTGGGVYGSGTFTNCTIAGNTATTYGGYFGGGTMINSIVYNNAPSAIPCQSVTTTYSNLEDLCSGEGNISDPPIFVTDSCGGLSDYALDPASPGVDGGTDTGAPSDDLCGAARFAGTIDMGAYEAHSSTIVITEASYDYQINTLQVKAESGYQGSESALYVEGVGPLTWIRKNKWEQLFTDIANPPMLIRVCGAIESCQVDK